MIVCIYVHPAKNLLCLIAYDPDEPALVIGKIGIICTIIHINKLQTILVIGMESLAVGLFIVRKDYIVGIYIIIQGEKAPSRLIYDTFALQLGRAYSVLHYVPPDLLSSGTRSF